MSLTRDALPVFYSVCLIGILCFLDTKLFSYALGYGHQTCIIKPLDQTFQRKFCRRFWGRDPIDFDYMIGEDCITKISLVLYVIRAYDFEKTHPIKRSNPLYGYRPVVIIDDNCCKVSGFDDFL